MRRAIFAAAVLFAATVSANAPHPLDLQSSFGFEQGHSIVEKQTWYLDGVTPDPAHTVVDPFSGVTWDINEHSEWSTSGDLAAGASTSRIDAHIFDFNPVYRCNGGVCFDQSFSRSNLIGFRVVAPSANLAVEVCFQPQAHCFQGVPAFDSKSKLFTYRVCATAVYERDDPANVPIDGSNGGYGVPTTITRSVTNQTGRAVKNVSAGWGVTSDISGTNGCPTIDDHTWPPLQLSYPWEWMN